MFRTPPIAVALTVLVMPLVALIACGGHPARSSAPGGGSSAVPMPSLALTPAPRLPTLRDPADWFVTALGMTNGRLCAADPATGQSKTLLDTNGAINGVAHEGDWVAWLQAATPADAGPFRLNVANLATGEHLCTALGAYIDLALSGHWLVWSHDLVPDRSAVVVTDLAANRNSQVPAAKGSQAPGGISYPWVAWAEGGAGCRARWLNLTTARTGAAAASDSGAPLVSGHWLVWCAPSSSESSPIEAKNLKTGAVTIVSPRGGRDDGSSDLVLSAPLVAWYDYSSSTLRAMDLASGKRMVVSRRYAEEDALAISGQWIVWHCWRPGGLFAYDVESGRTIRLSADTENGPWVLGSWVIWAGDFNDEGITAFYAYNLRTEARTSFAM